MPVAAPIGMAPALDTPRRVALEAGPEIVRRVKYTSNPDLMLATILDECHFLMREVATESAIRAETVQDRLAFVHTALACARTGAEVGKSIAALQATEMTEGRKDAIFNDVHKLAEKIKVVKANPDKQ